MAGVVTRWQRASQFCTDARARRSESECMVAERAEMLQQVFSWSTNSFIMLSVFLEKI